MENASKALLIGGSILIAMLTISIGLNLFMNYRDMGSSYERNLEATEIQKFNVNFTKFEERQDITIQEIVSLANFVREYNADNETEITVFLNSDNLADNENLIDIVKEKNKQLFKTSSIRYNSESGLVENITFR